MKKLDNYINEKLNSYRIIRDVNSIIKADHINGAFNYKNGEKVHSGFCISLSLDTVKNYKI